MLLLAITDISGLRKAGLKMKFTQLIFLFILLISISIFADQSNTLPIKSYSTSSQKSPRDLKKEADKVAREKEKKSNEADYVEFGQYIKKIGSGNGSCTEMCNKINMIAAEYDRQIAKCNQSKDNNEKIQYLKEAIRLCKTRIGSILSVLKALEGEHLDWQVKMKSVCRQERDRQKASLVILLNELPILEAIGKIQHLCDSAVSKERQAIAKKDSITIRNFANSNEVSAVLNETARLYEEAVVDFKNALSLPSSSQQKDVLQNTINIFNSQSKKYRNEASEWPSIILSQKNSRYEEIDRLKKESAFLYAQGKLSLCRDIYKRIELILDDLDKNGEKNTEELAGCHEQLAALDAEAYAKKLNGYRSLLSTETFRDNEKFKINQFYQGLIGRLGVKKSNQKAISLDGQDNSLYGDSLYTDQFYRYLIHREVSPSNLRVQVYENGENIYEEMIAIPMQGDLWDHYMHVDGMLLMPNGDLRSKFGLELRLTIVSDPYNNFALVIGQKSSGTKYDFTFFLDDDYLYDLRFKLLPPWQLEVLSKPELPAVKIPLSKTPLIKVNYCKGNDIKALYPVLDQFVEDMKQNPLSLAQYVHNEIENIDPFLTRHNGVFQAPAIHRNPFRTFLEKQGSPWEQCELLVYLLQKAGYDAQYLEGTCSLPAPFVEELLFLKLPGEQNIDLNYPGVLFFDGKEVHTLFPWMKEISTKEGHDLYSFMPDKYGNAEKWLMQYLCSDEEILKHIGPDGDDTLGVLFVRFVEEQLRKKGLSLQDVGTHRVLHKKQYNAWKDFPRPNIQSSLKPLQNLSARDDLFAHVTIKINSIQNPSKIIQLKNTRLADFSCQSHAIYFTPQGELNHHLHFCASDDWKNEQKLLLDASDHHINIHVSYISPLGNNENVFSNDQFSIAKGTCAALCHTAGGANAKLTSYFAEQFAKKTQEHERLQAFCSFVGTAYFEKCNRSEKLLATLHKVSPDIYFCVGLAKLSPDPGSITDLRFPQIDMHRNCFKVNHKNPYSPYKEMNSTLKQYLILFNADGSANEHQVLREIYQDPYAISTVKLLQIAHLKHQKKGSSKPGFLVFTAKSFVDAEEDPLSAALIHFSQIEGINFRQLKIGAQSQWNHLKSLFSSSDSAHAYAYMTPCAISSLDGFGLKPSSYTGVGTLRHGSASQGAMISDGSMAMNGGYGSRLPNNFMQTINNQEYQFVSNGNNYIFMSTKDVLMFGSLPSFQMEENKQASTILPTEKTKESSNKWDISGWFAGVSKWIPEVRLDYMQLSDWVGDPVDVVTGAFYVDELDLTLPGVFPLEIRRNYSSQSLLPGVFGFGWKLSLNPILFEEEDKLFASERDGTVIVYRRDETQNRWIVLPSDNPNLHNSNKNAVGGTANPFHSYIEEDNGHILYAADGSKRVYHNNLLVSWSDHAGNNIAFSYENELLERIESSSGGFLCFKYNHSRKISEIFSNDGRIFFYTYDSQGNLATVKLPNDAIITYEYDRFHRIIRESKPHGRLLENVYIEDKVSEQRSPVGPQQHMVTSASFTYSDGITIVTDGEGGTTEYKIYQNQIYKITDPEGNQTLQSWFLDGNTYFDAESEQIRPWNQIGAYPRSLQSTKDKRGLYTNYLYDTQGNIKELILNGEDLTGDGKTVVSKQFSYNARNLCTQEETLNTRIITTYDSTFSYLPKRIEKYVDETQIFCIDLEYTKQGLVKKENCSGAITIFEYDDRGFPTKKIQETGTDDPDLVTNFLYSDQGQCVDLITADAIQHTSYDIMGNPCCSTISLLNGQLISKTYAGYNLNNELIWKQGDDPNDTLFLDYNAAGLLKASRKNLSQVDGSSIVSSSVAYTLYEYDTCGRLLENIDPLGNRTHYQYDGLGRVLQTTKNGLTTTFTYEAGGLVKSVTTPNGATTSRDYTTNGYLKSETYPDGTQQFYLYDFFERQTQKIKNGISSTVYYNDATREEIYVDGDLTETRQLDARGNLISFTDSAEYTWLKTYDALNRLKTEISPNGETTSWSYQGDTIICIMPNGEQTVQRYEAGILSESQTFDSDGALITQTYHNRFPEQSMSQVILGDITMNTWKNTLGLPIRIQQGDKITIHYYDSCGNCIASEDGEGNITYQKYDPSGRLTQKILPDGAKIYYEYDANSNLIAYRMPGDLTWSATYDSMGNKLSEWQEKENQSFQHWKYSYNNGLLTQVKDPLDRIHHYEYDIHSRLLEEKVGNYTRTYSYDPRGLLSSVTESGVDISKLERSHDSLGRLTQEIITLNGIPLQNTLQEWTSSGRSLRIGDHQMSFRYRGGQLSQLSTNHFNLSYDYAPSGSLIRKTTSFSSSEIQYNPSSLPQRIDVQLNNCPHQESLQWTSSGKLKSHESTYPVSDTALYTYNSRGHLKSSQDHNYKFDFDKPGCGILTAAPNLDVSNNGLDRFGRIVEETIDSTMIITSYDALGQVTAKNNDRFTWDPWGRLIVVNSDTYQWTASYDALGRRLQTNYTTKIDQNSNGQSVVTTSFYDPEHEFQEIGTVLNGNIFWKLCRGSSCDAIIDSAGAVAVLHHDMRNNLIAVITPQTTQWVNDYPTPYGPRAPPQTIPSDLFSYAQSLAWQSKQVDPTGLIWLGARYYDPLAGRFLTTDPISHPLCLDLYAYGNGDPINNSDLNGRFSCATYDTVGATSINNKSSLPPKVTCLNAVEWINSPYNRSRSYDLSHLGRPSLPKGLGIGYFNGIQNSFKDGNESLEHISNLTGGYNIDGIYGATQGRGDLISCGLALHYIDTGRVKPLMAHWDKFFAENPDGYYLHICSSRGVLDTRNTLLIYPEEKRKRIIVLAFCPAAYIYADTCAKVIHYRASASRDLIPYIDGEGAEREKDTIVELKSHAKAPWHDHPIISPTYRDPIKFHCLKYIQSRGKSI